MTRLFELPQKSHIRDSSLYDNIYFQTDAVTEYLGRVRKSTNLMKRTLETTIKLANLAISDHRPVWAVFSTSRDDDGSDEGGSASVLMRTSKSTDPEPQPVGGCYRLCHAHREEVSSRRMQLFAAE